LDGGRGGGDAPRLYRPRGCAECQHTGYAGRTGLYELLPVDDPVRAIIHEQRSERDLRAHMTKTGARTLSGDAIRWLDGTTSLAEVMRVCETA